MNNIIELSIGIIPFVVIQLINVILSTCKSVVTIKGSTRASACMNSISYTFYAVVVKLIPMQDMIVVIIVTFLTNFFGVYIARWILNKFKKVKRWIFDCSVTDATVFGEITEVLSTMKVKYISGEAEDYKGVQICHMQIYSVTKEDSRIIKELLHKYNVTFHITESR